MAGRYTTRMRRPHGQTRERMLDAAAVLFERHGYGGVAVEDVTDAVGVQKPDLYNHFRDKRELYIATRRRALDRLEAELGPIAAMDAPARHRLEATARALMHRPAFLDALRRRDAETFLTDEARDFLFARAYGVLYAPITALLREAGTAAADLPFLFDALIALTAHFGPITPEPELPEVARRVADLLLPPIPRGGQ